MSKSLRILSIVLVAFVMKTSVSELIDGEEFIDPTRPLFASSNTTSNSDDVLSMIRNVVPSSYDVTFIRAGSNTPMAVVNSERVSLGDVVGGATVVSIDRSSVTLSVNGEERVISLYGDSIKSPASQ